MLNKLVSVRLFLFLFLLTKTNGLIFPKRRLKIGKIKHRPQKMVEGPFQSGRGLFQLSIEISHTQVHLKKNKKYYANQREKLSIPIFI